MIWILAIVVAVWMAIEWAAIAVLLRGLFWFLVGFVLLALLAAGYGVFYLLDTGLGRLVEWLGEHAEALE